MKLKDFRGPVQATEFEDSMESAVLLGDGCHYNRDCGPALWPSLHSHRPLGEQDVWCLALESCGFQGEWRRAGRPPTTNSRVLPPVLGGSARDLLLATLKWLGPLWEAGTLLWRAASRRLMTSAPAVRFKAVSATDQNGSPGSADNCQKTLCITSVRGNCASQTSWRVWTNFAITWPSSCVW